ncbi:MAG: transcription antitermination factor NusB [Gemmatimonadota bacterium]|jgi:N utilization substance protein B
MSGFNPRSRARSWALHMLYAWDVSDGEQTLPSFAEANLALRTISPRYRPYAETLLAKLSEQLPRVDRKIQGSLANWRLGRLTAIDRSILRLATTELLEMPDVPTKVAIHEAIRLAERYGTEESPRFVNGVLDAVARDRNPKA